MPVIIDGDKQYALIMQFIRQLLERMDLEESVALGVAVTEYANPAVVRFYKLRKIPCSAINGEREATEQAKKYTIGATSHANGSGTLHVKWDELNKALLGKEQRAACRKLRAFLKIANPCASDAIATLLMVEAVLKDKDFGVGQLSSSLFKDHPCARFKAPVADRSNFTTDQAGTRLTDPIIL